tara:strand:+ start:40597 stop:41886 length:1290 start_codon:yes stop_codon:yes gene_type:complete
MKQSREPANDKINEVSFQQCLDEVKKSCYEEYPFQEMIHIENEQKASVFKSQYLKCFYDKSQSICEPTSAYKNEKNKFEKEFFREINNAAKKKKHKGLVDWQLLKKFKEALWKFKILIKTHTKSMLNGLGVGVSMGASAIAGVTQGYELIHHNGKVGVFCAPGMKVATDIGVYADLVFVNSLMCRNNQHYRGQFLSLALSGSLEIAGIPGEVGAGYSLGIELFQFRDQMKRIKSSVDFSKNRLNEEMFYLQEYVNDHPELKSKMGVVIFYNKIIRTLLKLKVKFDPLKTAPIRMLIQEAFRKKFSLGSLGKDYAMLTKKASEKYDFIELGKVADALESSLSGCDSFSTFVGASLSLSPISLSVSLTSYGLAGELSFQGLKSALSINLNRKAIRQKREFYYSLFDIVTSLAGNKCNQEETRNLLDFWTKQ